MFIVTKEGKYWAEGWGWVIYRDDAQRFSSKQEAKDFMAKYSITGSIIPA